MSQLEPIEERREVMALSGLWRLVLHARDQLHATATAPKWMYNHDAWSPQQIQRHVAQQLAESVLTLVADCLPADGSLSADEASQLRRQHEDEGQNWAKQLQALKVKVAEMEGDIDELVSERDLAVESQSDSELAAEEARAELEKARELARKSAPRAIRLLLGEPDPVAAATPQPAADSRTDAAEGGSTGEPQEQPT